MIPGLEHAQFARYGVMHRNTFINAPELLNCHLELQSAASRALPVRLYVAGQLSGTEGYVEAIASGLLASLNVRAAVRGIELDPIPRESAFGALIDYATDPETKDYQPMPPFEERIRNKQQRYEAYAQRGSEAMKSYVSALVPLLEGTN